MDTIDSKMLAHLMANGRASWAELATLAGLSAPAVAERVRRLEAQGIIQGYAALLQPDAVGNGLLAFIEVALQAPAEREAFLTAVQALPAVQECHHIAGDYDFLLKVRCGATRALEAIISDRIKAFPGQARTRTTVVLSTIKETPALPLQPPLEAGG